MAKSSNIGVFSLIKAGPAGIFTHKEVFTSIYNTIKQVFKCKSSYSLHLEKEKTKDIYFKKDIYFHEDWKIAYLF